MESLEQENDQGLDALGDRVGLLKKVAPNLRKAFLRQRVSTEFAVCIRRIRVRDECHLQQSRKRNAESAMLGADRDAWQRGCKLTACWQDKKVVHCKRLSWWGLLQLTTNIKQEVNSQHDALSGLVSLLTLQAL